MSSAGLPILALLLAGALVAAGCTSAPQATDDRPSVVVTLLAYQWLATAIGGDSVVVTNIVPPGSSPHEFDPTPRDLVRLYEADLVLVNGVEIEAWFTQAVKDLPSSVKVLRAADSAKPLLAAGAHTISLGESDEEEGPNDPHLWLDPIRLAAVGDDLTDALASLVPVEERESLVARGQSVHRQLLDLNATIGTALGGDCARRTILTTHDSMAYLADRYDLSVVSILGISPDEEPSPARLQQIAEAATERGITTILVEPNISTATAQALAEQIHGTTQPLDPVESINPHTDLGADYLKVMTANLPSLEVALGCP